MAEHRFAMAMHLDRPLRSDEHVHHLNGVKTDNRLDNLELWSRSHPSEMRIEDLLEYAQTIIEMYGEEFDCFLRRREKRNPRTETPAEQGFRRSPDQI